MSLVVLRYTLLRLVLFAAVFAVLALAGARGVLLLGLTVVISLILSYLLLRGQRDAVAAVIAERMAERVPGPQPAAGGSDEALEDAEDDARRAGGDAPAGPAGPAGPAATGDAAGVAPVGEVDLKGQDEESAPKASPRPSSTP